MQRFRLLASTAVAVVMATLAVVGLRAGDTPAEKRDKINDTAEIAKAWIYDDLPSAIAAAKRDNKPLLIVFR